MAPDSWRVALFTPPLHSKFLGGWRTRHQQNMPWFVSPQTIQVRNKTINLQIFGGPKPQIPGRVTTRQLQFQA